MRVAKTVLRGLLFVLTFVVGAAAAAVVVSQTGWFRGLVRSFAVSAINPYLDGEVSIGSLSGNLLFGTELHDVRLTTNGRPVAEVDGISLDYNAFDMFTQGLVINRVALRRPILHLFRENGAWTIASLVKARQDDVAQGGGVAVIVDAIGIDEGAVLVESPWDVPDVNLPQRFDHVNGALAASYDTHATNVTVHSFSFQASDPTIMLQSFAGDLTFGDTGLAMRHLTMQVGETALALDGSVKPVGDSSEIEVNASSPAVALPELARIVPALQGVDLTPGFTLQASGPLDRLATDLEAHAAAGQVQARLTMDLAAPGQAAMGEVRLDRLNLAPILNDTEWESQLTGVIGVDLKADPFSDVASIVGRLTVESPSLVLAGYQVRDVSLRAGVAGPTLSISGRTSAYGAGLTADGRVTLPVGDDMLRFNLSGRASRVDLARMPRRLSLPDAQTELNASYQAEGAFPSGASRHVAVTTHFDDSAVPGARILSGSTAALTLEGGAMEYSADATLAELNLRDVGRAFDVPALDEARFDTRIGAQISAQGSGTTADSLVVTAKGTLSDSDVLGGRVEHLAFEGGLDEGTARLTADGAFSRLDLASATGRDDLQGAATGSLTLEGTLANVWSGVSVDSVAGDLHLTLQPSTVGGLELQSATLDGSYRRRVGDIRTFEVSGPDLNLTASGILDLTDTGASALTYSADSQSLETLGGLFDAPIAGIGRISGKVTGNYTALQAAGTVSADALRYGENGALNADGTYSVRLPALEVDALAADADLKATFVTLAGQDINEASARVTYATRALTFEAKAAQPERQLEADGTLDLLPGRQEVRLTRLVLDSGDQQWTLAEGASPLAGYETDALSVEDLTLVSGNQRIAVDGTLGPGAPGLEVRAEGVELASLERLMLRPPQYSGTLNATASVTGEASDPRVSGQFEVADGAFRNFHFESLGGTVGYQPGGLTLDARLQQDAAQWITARGYVPTALFSDSAPPFNPNVERDASDPNRVDLSIESSRLDLGLIQGFTTALTNVSGSLEANVRIAGTADDPQPDGTIRIADGAATVVPTGVAYSNIAGVIDLRPDRLHTDNLVVLDNQDNALSITGDLAVRAGQVSAFQIWINASDFKIIDNKLGSLRIETATSLSGRMTSPIVQGYLGVTTGDVDLDEVMALLGTSTYRTPDAEPAAGAEVSAPAGPFDAMRLNVDLTVPNALVVKADSLQAPGSPIGLGALNVTLGGDLRATKDPGGPLRLVGDVTTIRGTYDFQGRRFEILRDGSVRFDGVDMTNPVLNVRTRRLISGVEARVNVAGRLQEPEIILTSTPPLEPADILSLIVFNQPVNQLGEGDQVSLAQRAQALATGAVAGQLSQSIGNALNLDTFEINVASDRNGGDVTIGQQLSQNLYVKVQQDFGDQATTNFVFEYQINNWLRVQSTVAQGQPAQQSLFRRSQGTGIDLIFTFSY